MTSRKWIKVFCSKWIEGTLREETPDIRGIWIDLLALAGTGQYGDIGEIKLTNGVGYTDEQIGEILHINKALWHKAKARLVATDRMKISPRGAISITNWSKYQSDYERQKPYREAKRDSPTPEPKSPLTIPLENKKKNKKESYTEKLQCIVTTESYNEKLQRGTRDRGFLEDKSVSEASSLKERVSQYFKEHEGPARSVDIAKAIGSSPQEIALFFYQHKGSYSSPQRGVWRTRSEDKTLGKRLGE